MCESFGGDKIAVTDADGWAEYVAGVAGACPRLQFVLRADGATCAPVFQTARRLWTGLKDAADNPVCLATWDESARDFFDVCSQMARAPSRATAMTGVCHRSTRGNRDGAIDTTTLTVALACVWVLREVDRHHEITRGHHQVFLDGCTEPLVEAVQSICQMSVQHEGKSRKKSKSPGALCTACASRVKKSPN